MSDLQLALIASGVAVVAGVLAYNKWLELKQKKAAEKVFKGHQPDALMGALPPTPEVPAVADDESSVIEPAQPVVAGERREPVMPEGAVAAPAEPTLAADLPESVEVSLPPLPEQYVDEVADCVVRIDFAAPTGLAALWALASRWAGRMSKPLTWLGLEDIEGDWRKIGPGDVGRFRAVCASLQLANRAGAINDGELSTFLEGMWELAEKCGGRTGIPDRDQVLAIARNIDEFCAGVDVQLGVKIVGANEPMTGARLRELAEAAGLTLLDDGAFHYLDVNGVSRFTLANIGAERFDSASLESLATHGVTLSMDVPRVPDGPTAFDALIAVARPLTDALGGILVDAQGNPLTMEMIGTIRAKIVQLQGLMAQQQIVAGSPRALRLFS